MIKAIIHAGRSLVSGLAVSLCFAAGAGAQQKIEMKIAYFMPDQHVMGQWFVKWSEQLEKGSGGRIVVKRFPNAQIGPAPGHYDFVRTGQADVVWFLHGLTPGRFPLTEIINLPFMVGSAEMGIKMINDTELRAKYLDAEHRGVKVLMLLTQTPGGVHTTRKPIRTLDDFKGLRLRFASPMVRDFAQALGATPVGLPPTEIAEQLQKGTIDGTFIEYSAAATAFRLAGIVKHSTDMYAYTASFGVAMNEDFWNKLPPDLKKLVADTFTGKEKEVGEAWDAIDVPGKKLLMDAGGEAIQLSAGDNARLRKIGAEVSEAKLKELEGKGLPARAVYNMMRALAEKHSKTSKNFWK